MGVEVDSDTQDRERRGLRLDVVFVARRLRGAGIVFFEVLEQQHDAGAVPEEDLQFVLRLADEDKDLSVITVVSERALEPRTEAVDTAFACR